MTITVDDMAKNRVSRRTALGVLGGAGLVGVAGVTTLSIKGETHHPGTDLRSQLRRKVLFRGDEGYDAERAAWNLNVDHRPRVIVVAETREDVAAAVRYAADEGLPVAVQAIGHGQARGAPGDALLLLTGGLRDVTVEPEVRIARVAAGATWRQVIDATAPHGLAPLNGSTSELSAVGYLTGGGLPVLGRTHGYAADRVRSVDVVTADGRLRRASATEEPDLFWAVRGGMSNFGIVTSTELELVPQRRFFGGGMMYPAAAADAVLRRWIDWSLDLPDEMTTSLAVIQFPDLPDIPEPVRGKHMVHVRVAHAGTVANGEQLVAPLRELEPVVDQLAERPYREVDAVHQDPVKPAPVVETSRFMSNPDDGFVRRFVDIVGPAAQLPPGPVELRRLGGALGRPTTPANAIGRRDEEFLLVVATVNAPGGFDDAIAFQDGVLEQLEPWTTDATFPNFLGNHADARQVRACYREGDYQRLRSIKADYDPANLFRINHNIPPKA